MVTPFSITFLSCGNRTGAIENRDVEKSGLSSRECGRRSLCIATSRIRRLEPAVDIKAQRLLMNVEEILMPCCAFGHWVVMLRWCRFWKIVSAVVRTRSKREGDFEVPCPMP